jgi:hypothetical protein
MANNDSTIVTNLEATPSSVADASVLYGKQRALVETFEIAAADNNADTYTLFPVSLDARIDDLQIFNDAITGGTDYDIGFYKITDNDLGAAIDADKLMDGQSMASARNVWTSVLGLGTSAVDLGTEGAEKVWELCGYASIDAARDANQTNQVYVVITANTVGTAAGSLSVKAVLTVE